MSTEATSRAALTSSEMTAAFSSSSAGPAMAGLATRTRAGSVSPWIVSEPAATSMATRRRKE